jgi:hypothetical protein
MADTIKPGGGLSDKDRIDLSLSNAWTDLDLPVIGTNQWFEFCDLVARYLKGYFPDLKIMRHGRPQRRDGGEAQ